jgi:hypothetical protein
MDKCFFNSCILNDKEKFRKYKQHNRSIKKFYMILDENNELVKEFDFIIKGKKYTFCIEHYNNLKLLKEIKKEINNSSSIETKTLIEINNLLHYDVEMKKLFSKLEIKKKQNIINFLFELISKNEKDRNNELYILTIINHLLKEYQICKDYSNDTNYEILINYLKNLNVRLYDVSSNKKIEISEEEFLTNIILYELTMNNISQLFINSKEKILSLELSAKLLENLTSIFGQCLTTFNLVDNKKITIEVFYTVINFINSYFLSKNKQIDMIVFLINFIIKCSNMIYNFIKYSNDNNIKKVYIVTLYSILIECLNLKMSDLNIDDLLIFAEDSYQFIKDKEAFPLFYEIMNKITEIKNKIRIHKSKISVPEE